MLVVDVSAVFGFLFFDESTAYADALKDYMTINPVIAPDFFRIEANTILRKQERRGRFSKTHVDYVYGQIISLDILYRRLQRSWFDAGHLLELQRRHDLTAYDAVYLALALQTQYPLATSDKHLAQAAQRENLFWPGTA